MRRLRAHPMWGPPLALAALIVLALVTGVVGTGANTPPEDPRLPSRTPIPSADKGGLLGDGRVILPSANRTGWKTYTNNRFGYSFSYPPAWEFTELDNSDMKGPRGETVHPVHHVAARNPKEDRGENTPGKNCDGSGCIGALPGLLGFSVAITNAHCNAPGELLAADRIEVDGKIGSRCVLRSLNDGNSQSALIAFELSDNDTLLEIRLVKGRDVDEADQAILNTILDTFKFTRGR